MKTLTILDGGMGRELKDIGAPFSQPLWSAQALIESPEHVRKAHQNFIDAGAQIIISNSYACVPFHLGEKRYQKSGYELAEQAAIIAQTVAQSSSNLSVRVAGSIPPPFGSYRPDLFKANEATPIIDTLYRAQLPYVDLWIAETISSLEEFDALHLVLKNTDKDCYYAFSLSDDPTLPAALRSGQTVVQAAERICSTNAKAIFFNCSVPEVMDQAIIEAKKVIDQFGSDIVIGVYANNFAPIASDHEANGIFQSMRELSPAEYLVYAKRWYELGASIIGGCCGIGPTHIQALANWKDNLE